MLKKIQILGLIALVLSSIGCLKPESLSEEQLDERLSGGSQTVFDAGSGAYSHQFPTLSARSAFNHGVGDGSFEATFVTAPAPINPGLGPIFNNVSCASCHIADGRGRPPLSSNELLSSMLVRISIPGENPHGGPNPAPGFGGQLQQRGVYGKPAEADVVISYSYIDESFADGTSYSLRQPSIQLENPYIPLPAGYMLSGRVAPPVFGMGLLEAIDEATLNGLSDEFDSNGDGISGRPNQVWDAVKKQKTIGRFGWKAGNPSVIQQTAGAYNEDMGITSFIFPEESSLGQSQYDGLDDDHELSDSLLYANAFYTQTLAVPARRNVDKPEVKRGKELFKQANCSGCHTPMVRTGTNIAFPEASNQIIFPYTDLLLHDMGSELADNRPEFIANGQEWRTSPLWGIGLTELVNGHSNYLHDGRARNLMEAILWHGGEGKQSRDFVKNLNKSDREALLAFLKSL
jgi:CxxC motif-containing protein (DUF1111 family)